MFDEKWGLETGLYFGYGLTGKFDADGTKIGTPVSENYGFFEDKNNRFDMGVMFSTNGLYSIWGANKVF